MALTGQAAAAAPSQVANAAANQERKRVKVYELRNNDWFDRGTGFCTGQYYTPTETNGVEGPDARILVAAEDDPSNLLLETRIRKDDGYQKQQDTLIVWTESSGVDMALSFQEAEGCGQIWEFVSDVQTQLTTVATGDDLSDDLLDHISPLSLPDPQLGRLDEIENTIRNASASPTGRDALSKFVQQNQYILKLAPLVQDAEDLESTADLHRLCTIMKHLILLNDTAIIEFCVTDEAIMGVVGALEYDPDFPSHRANHRQWLSDTSRFKEVVPIDDPAVKKKIHWTYRLLYLKDVVLARILDDPTFSVLNSLIFFHQVDIVNHLQQSGEWLKLLFDIFSAPDFEMVEKKKEAVLFIQNCCAVSKNIQAANRAHLYVNFINHGLFTVITFALRHRDPAVRVAGTDILVALIDHDPHMVRNHIFAALKEGHVPLTDILIELLLVEVDLGVKSQMADAIKILLDPSATPPGVEMNRGGAGNAEIMAKQRSGMPGQPGTPQSLGDAFVEKFYDVSAKRMFAPLKALESRPTMMDLTIQDTSLYTHLVDVLCFFVRQHAHKSKLFILSESLHSRVAQLLDCPQKYMKLMALKWFRTCIGLQDEFHNRQMMQNSLFDPILRIVEETMPRDNLLNSACLELFEYIKREGLKQLIVHLVQNYRERLMRMSYVNTFQTLVLKYDQLMSGYPSANGAEDSSFTTQEGTPQRMVNGRQSFAGLKEMDGDEEAYFNGDEEGEDDESLPTMASSKHGLVNGASPVRPLVNYPDDEDDEGMDILASSPDHHLNHIGKRSSDPSTSSSDEHHHQLSTDPLDNIDEPMDEDTTSPTGPISTHLDDEKDDEPSRGRNRNPVSPAHRDSPPRTQDKTPSLVAMKRRRDDEDEDELGKMMAGVKRRNSSTSSTSLSARLGQGRTRTTSVLRSNTATTATTAVAAPSSAEDIDDDAPALENKGGPVQNANSLDPDDDDEQSLPSSSVQETKAHSNGAPALRRKGSLKTKNETPASAASAAAGKFSIKPVNLARAKEKAQGDREGGSSGEER